MTAASTEVHEMIVVNPGSPTRYSWNGVPADKVKMKAKFDELMATGLYLAYQTVDVGKPTEKNVQIPNFVEEAERIVLTPRLVGGVA